MALLMLEALPVLTWPQAVLGIAIVVGVVCFFGFFTDNIQIRIGKKG